MRKTHRALRTGTLLLCATALLASAHGGELPRVELRPGSAAPPPEAKARRTPFAPDAAARQARTLAVQEVSSGTTLARGLCLGISLGAGAASECGDLRLAHVLPAVRTLSQSRAPVLIYNSQHASPARWSRRTSPCRGRGSAAWWPRSR